MSNNFSLSKRNESLPTTKYMEVYSARKAHLDPFNPKTNPKGYTNLGTAVNGLMDDILLEKFQTGNFFQPQISHFRYYQFWGSDSLRELFATFMERFFKPASPISYENIFFLNGSLLSLDVIGALIADPNEVVLVPTPSYNGHFEAFTQRWDIRLCQVPMAESNNPDGGFFDLDLSNIENAYFDELKKGHRVKAILFNNPHNPLGIVFPRAIIIEIMKFCNKYKLHLIVDEMFALSVHDPKVRFQSVLEIENASFIDPNYLHLVWGFSKNWVWNLEYEKKKIKLKSKTETLLFRVVHTRLKPLQDSLKAVSMFQAVSLPTLQIIQNFIKDLDWIEKTYVPENCKRLRISYNKAKLFVEEMGLRVSKSEAGFYFLVDLRTFIDSANKEESCKELFKRFYENKVYITPSWDIRAEFGWFRIVFSVDMSTLEKGLERFKKTLEDWQKIPK